MITILLHPREYRMDSNGVWFRRKWKCAVSVLYLGMTDAREADTVTGVICTVHVTKWQAFWLILKGRGVPYKPPTP